METKSMTEKEIIQYWVNNHKEMRAFVAAPEECQVWLKEHKKIIFHLNGIGKWVKTSKENKIVAFSIFTIHEDILKEKESGFIEFDIDDLDVFTHPFGANGSDRKRTHWYDYLDAVQSCGLFAGWFFENKAGAGWSIFQMGETETGGWTTIADDWVKPLVPKKIRFYKGV